MSEQKELSFQEQKKLKLKIEDVIPEYLDGEMKRSALDFVAFMRANHKGQNVCVIRLSEGSWRVVPRISRWNKLIHSYSSYEKEITEEGLQDIALANANICRRCANCGPGWGMTFFGREYGNVCHNVPVRYMDPDEAEINYIKRILEWMRHTVGKNKQSESEGLT